MRFKQLPEKYYLQHFFEFIDYIKDSSIHLLDKEQIKLIKLLAEIEENSLCLYVRMLNRQSPCIKKESLIFEEISNINETLEDLKSQDLIDHVPETEYKFFIEHLTKPELQSLCHEYIQQCEPLELSNSMNSNDQGHEIITSKIPKPSHLKSQWLTFTLKHVSHSFVNKSSVYKNYVYLTHGKVFQYLLFLYFGKLGSKLNQFSLRDLGIIKTYRRHDQINPNFRQIEHAKSAFFYTQLVNEAKRYEDKESLELAQQILTYAPPQGRQAEDSYHLLLYKLAQRIYQQDDLLAMQLLSQSKHIKAVEKYIRELYKKGEIKTCQTLLEDIIENGSSENLMLFANDFYQRKFANKKISIMTEMLRESNPPVALDEAYLGNVEMGMQDYYLRHNYIAIYSENKLWRALFVLFFWYELYEHPKSSNSNEFDKFPRLLANQTFYQVMKTEIETKLDSMFSKEILMNLLSKNCVKYYAKPNGIFRWNSRLLSMLKTLVSYAELEAIKNILRYMAVDYDALSDGFPDLLVIKNDQLVLEEIKAPGDSLRQNQVISIQKLKQAGFHVNIQRTIWKYDPTQAYVIVDIETTGGNKDINRITEIAMVKVVNGEVIDKWHSLINPQRHIPFSITRLTGIDDEMVANAPLFADIANEVDEFSKEAIFVAHNVNFDLGFIKSEFARIERTYRRPKLCTVQLAKKKFPELDSYSLGNLCHRLDIKLERHHRALDDALAASEIFLMSKSFE